MLKQHTHGFIIKENYLYFLKFLFIQGSTRIDGDKTTRQQTSLKNMFKKSKQLGPLMQRKNGRTGSIILSGINAIYH